MVCQLSPGGKAGGCGALLPVLRVGGSGGQAMPRLNAHKAHRLCGSRPDERIGVALHPAGDIAAGVLFADANGASAQACHAEAVVGKQVIGQLDRLLVLPLVIALATQQAVGAGIEDDRAFRPVKTELVVGGGVLGVERHIERRVEARCRSVAPRCRGLSPAKYGARSCPPVGRCW